MFSKLNLSCFIILISFFLGLSAFAQSGFEGKIVLRITDEETTDIAYFAKGENTRMEIDSKGNKVVIFHNLSDRKTTMYMPDQNMHMEVGGNSYMPQGNMNTKKDKNVSGKIERSKEFIDIQGRRCEKWTFTDEDSKVIAWMTDQLGGFFMMMNPMDKGSTNSWQQKLHGNYFPMKVDVIEDGEKKSSMEVLSVEEMSLKDDFFKVDPSSKKFNVPGMDMFK